jgi:hypothetical protein
MSFSGTFAGHVPAAPAPDPAADPATVPAAVDSAAVELELYEALRGVLSDPKYGVGSSSFGGSHVTGSLHQPDA